MRSVIVCVPCEIDFSLSSASYNCCWRAYIKHPMSSLVTSSRTGNHGIRAFIFTTGLGYVVVYTYINKQLCWTVWGKMSSKFQFIVRCVTKANRHIKSKRNNSKPDVRSNKAAATTVDTVDVPPCVACGHFIL